jgi:hypothetical protein
MFRMLDAAATLMPQNPAVPHYCFDFTYCYCSGTWHGCGWYFYSHVPCIALTTRTIVAQAPVCEAGTNVIGPTPEYDPVEELQALRKQLEVAMAGLEAQERVLRQQKEAARGGAAAVQPERK